MLQKLSSLAALALVLGAVTTEGNEMDSKIEAKIAQAAQASKGWKAEEVRVDEISELRRGECSVYRAGHKVRPLPYQLHFALLSGDQIVGSTEKDTAARILSECGAGAPASWWAEIVARFSLGGGRALQDQEQDTAVVKKLAEAGKSFAPPALSSEGEVQTLSFYLMEYEAYILYQVTATRRPDGSLEVSKVQAL